MHYFDTIVACITLTTLEIVLCVDNLIFLAILTNGLPKHQRTRARYWGLSFAWITRLLLLAFAVCLAHLKAPLFVWHGISFSVRTLFLGVGGFFLITKATQEIHNEVDKRQHHKQKGSKKTHSMWFIVAQIAMMDMVFSFDSVLTAIGLTNDFWVMAFAITVSIIVMLYLSTSISAFITAYPGVKMLALCFLFFIGILLIADGCSFHIPREYLYVAMGFSLTVEFLNCLRTKRSSV